jgi:FtsH-binding integral membrane protein
MFAKVKLRDNEGADAKMEWNRERDVIDISSRTGLVAQGFMQRIYGWMTLGLLVTAGVSYLVTTSPALLGALFGGGIAPFMILVFAEFGIVVYLSARVHTMNPSTASVLFFIYSALNGVTLAPIFLIYTGESVATAFFVTAGLFGGMSAYGAMTKRDLTDFGSFLGMGVFGLLIAMLVNMFLRSEMTSYVISGLAVIIFTGLSAYDTWVLRRMAAEGRMTDNYAVLGALKLYLDFITIFVHLLRLFGKRR